METGFGLAPIKQEGKCSSYMSPHIKPWPDCGNGFDTYFDANFSRWYLLPFKNQIKKIVASVWDAAILGYVSHKQNKEQ